MWGLLLRGLRAKIVHFLKFQWMQLYAHGGAQTSIFVCLLSPDIRWVFLDFFCVTDITGSLVNRMGKISQALEADILGYRKYKGSQEDMQCVDGGDS